MAAVTIIKGDLTVQGNIIPTTLTIPDGTIINADVSSSASITYDKLEHQD